MDVNETVRDPFYLNAYEWTKNLVSIYMSLSFLIGIPGNILVVLVHVQIKEKSVTDWLIFYIAVCDIFSLLSAPLFVCLTLGYWASGFPNWLCKLQFLNWNSTSMASYLLCACTALERHCKVVLTREMVSILKAKYLWIPVALVSFGVGIISIWAVSNNANGNCTIDTKKRNLSTIQYGLMSLITILSSIVMMFCYVRVGIFLMQKVKALTQSVGNDTFMKSYRKTIQITKMLAIVTSVFFISANVPFLLGILATVLPVKGEPLISIVFCLGNSVFINKFFNPILYLCISVPFRQRARYIIRVLFHLRTSPPEELYTVRTEASN